MLLITFFNRDAFRDGGKSEKLNSKICLNKMYLSFQPNVTAFNGMQRKTYR